MIVVRDRVGIAKIIDVRKETKNQKKVEEKFELDEEQLKILEDEYHQNMVNKEIMEQEREELIYEYQTKHHLSRDDAVTRIARDRLEY